MTQRWLRGSQVAVRRYIFSIRIWQTGQGLVRGNCLKKGGLKDFLDYIPWAWCYWRWPRGKGNTGSDF